MVRRVPRAGYNPFSLLLWAVGPGVFSGSPLNPGFCCCRVLVLWAIAASYLAHVQHDEAAKWVLAIIRGRPWFPFSVVGVQCCLFSVCGRVGTCARSPKGFSKGGGVGACVLAVQTFLPEKSVCGSVSGFPKGFTKGGCGGAGVMAIQILPSVKRDPALCPGAQKMIRGLAATLAREPAAHPCHHPTLAVTVAGFHWKSLILDTRMHAWVCSEMRLHAMEQMGALFAWLDMRWYKERRQKRHVQQQIWTAACIMVWAMATSTEGFKEEKFPTHGRDEWGVQYLRCAIDASIRMHEHRAKKR